MSIAFFKRLALLAFCLIPLRGMAVCAPSSDAVSGPFGGQNSSVTWSHTVGAGTGRALVVSVVTTGGATISSVMYGAQAMTSQVSTGDGSNQQHIFLFTLLSPNSGTASIVVTFSGAPVYVCGAQSFSGVGSLGAVNFDNVAGFSNTGSLPTTQPNSMIAGVVSAVNNQNTTFSVTNGSGQSTAWGGTGSNGALVNGQQFYYQAGAAGANSLTSNFVPGSGFNTPASSMGLVELIPAVCGTPTFSPTISPTFTASPVVSPTPTYTLAPFTCPSWIVNGEAALNGAKVLLTGHNSSLAGNPMRGSAWANSCLNLTQNFNFTYKIYLGADGTGGEGIAFVLQKSGTAALGDCGPGLGYGAGGTCGGTAIPTSLEVELRTGGSSGTVAIDENGATNQNGCPAVTGPCPTSALASAANIKDGQEHTFQLIWDASAKQLQVYVDGSLRLTYTKDIVAALFGGTTCVTYGFTGGTAVNGNVQYFYDPNCVVTPSACTNWVLQGTSAYTAPNQIQFTPANTRFLIAAAWAPVCVDLTQNFDFNYQVYLGNNTPGNGADGIGFVLQKGGTSVLGTEGGDIGVGGIANSVAVEIDTYQNGGEPAYDHIAVDENGVANHSGAGPVQASAIVANTNVKDNALHTFEVKWNAATTTMSIYFDGAFRLSYTKDIINLIFGGQTCVTYGYTSATGYFTDQQYIIDQNCIFSPTPTPTSSITVSATPTRTPSATPSATPTATPSRTPSPSPSATPSATPTPSPSPSPTASPTRTPTATPSPSPSASLTATQSATASATPSATPTASPTASRTATPTATPSSSGTPSPTASPTVTASASVTVTRSSTPSPTTSSSATPTLTPSATPTHTKTATQSATVTASPTATATATATPSPTASASVTATPSASRTPTASASPTPTSTATQTATESVTASVTPTVTATATESASRTVTLSPSPTPTVTLSHTASPIASSTNTPTETLSATASATPTITLSFSFTVTSTLTSSVSLTASPTRTVTFSPTQTLSATPSLSESPSPTVTLSSTDTFTPTVTGTQTQTFTFTETPVPMPYSLTVTIYNSAGEVVKTAYQGSVQLAVNSIQSSGDSFQAGAGQLALSFAGKLSGGGTQVIWKGDNDQGQLVSGGIYYVKVEVKDNYGTVQAYSKSVSILPPAKPATLILFNGAGEAVAHLSVSGYPEAITGFSLPQGAFAMSPAGDGNAPASIPITLQGAQGSSYVYNWIPQADSGASLSSGSYVMQLVQGGSAGTTVLSKGLTLVAVPGKSPLTLSIGPNPATSAQSLITLRYSSSALNPAAKAGLYNLAGELVALAKNAGPGILTLESRGLAGGIYLVCFELRDNGQFVSRKALKIAIIR